MPRREIPTGHRSGDPDEVSMGYAELTIEASR